MGSTAHQFGAQSSAYIGICKGAESSVECISIRALDHFRFIVLPVRDAIEIQLAELRVSHLLTNLTQRSKSQPCSRLGP